MERLRSGEPSTAFVDPAGFTTEAFIAPVGARDTLLEVRVEVSWHAEPTGTFVLRSLRVR
jgi:hypothetical protein